MKKLEKKQIILFSIITIICVVAIGIAVYVLVFREAEVKKKGTLSQEEEQTLIANFDGLFKNAIEMNGYDIGNVIRRESDKELIYTSYQKQNKVDKRYEIQVDIPNINIENDIIRGLNDGIKKTYQEKVNSIMTTTSDSYTIYHVTYTAYVQQEVLSLVIKSTLKEGQNPQRVIVTTYNYDLKTPHLLTLEETGKKLNISKETIQNKITQGVTEEEKQASELRRLGYNNIYERDINSDMYQVANTNNFFIGPEGYLYILYAYGNRNYTNAMDIMIMSE